MYKQEKKQWVKEQGGGGSNKERFGRAPECKAKKARTPEGSEGACMDARPGLVGMEAD